MTTIRRDLSGVLASSMCIGCGACQAADPTISIVLDPVKQIYEPDHVGGPEAAAVCPAVAVDFPGLQARNFPGETPGPFGVVKAVHLAQSTDLERNRRSSSGGIIKELLHHLLADPEVDGIIALGHVEGLDFRPRIVRRAEEIEELPGSIYHNLAQPQALQLLEETEGRFVVVAIPCHLEGLFTYIEARAPHLRSRIHSTVGLLCGWQYSHHALRAICAFKGIDFDDIQDISYRGGGPIGKLVIHTSKGSRSIGRRVDFGYQVAFDRSFNTPRCHVCVNHGNVLADVVVGDAWLPSTVATTTGISIVVSRTAAMADTIDQLFDEGRIRAVPVSEDEIQESQKRNVVYGDFAYAYAEHLDRLGLHRPDMVAPNRVAARLASPRSVERFHDELVRKLRLQQQGRYRLLYLRKGTVELHRHAAKYLRWFGVRILRLKSLTGTRREVSRDLLKGFR
ncbi:MAG TPA: Coenzyme F420 hydrogenase/dehydrogenase, beta subunit C-terminal domain [Acidimicrobiales bacterium]